MAAVGDEQPQALPPAALAYKRVKFVNKMDDTSGLKPDVLEMMLGGIMGTWRPTLESGWYYLGQGASTYAYDATPTPPSGVIVHALEEDALRDVASWEPVWTHKGSSEDYALWRGVPPNSDYAVIGGILSTSANFAAPDSAQTYGIKAIRRDLLAINPVFKFWDTNYSQSLNEASVWLSDATTGIDTGAMIPTVSLSTQPPEDMCLTLDPTKVLEITSTSAAAEGNVTTSKSSDK